MNEELISVIVPIYNVEKYLKECINSIRNQTYKNIEIILVDDGSNDDCPKICDEFEKIDSRIKVVHKENGGLSDARNAGIKIASGSYISLIDSDDIINVRMLEVLYKNLKDNNADLSICNIKIFIDDEEKIDCNEKDIDNNQVIFADIKKFDNLFNNCIGTTVVAWNKLYKKELFNNIKYPKGKIHEDVYVIHHILENAKIIVYTDARLYYYRQRKSSISKSLSTRRVEELEGMKDRMLFFNSKYSNMKYANLSTIAYYDKLIRLYCIFKYNNIDNKFESILISLKKEYNNNYSELLKIAGSHIKKIKYVAFRYFSNIYYNFNIKKYI